MRDFLSLFLFMGVPAIAFLLGLSKLPWWTIAVCPVVELAVWGWKRVNVDPTYDEKGVIVAVAVLFAIASFVTWTAGRGLSGYVRFLGRQPPPRQAALGGLVVVAAAFLLIAFLTLLYTPSRP